MFVLDPAPRFTHEITARVPVDGGFDDQTFKVTYQMLPDEEIAAIDLDEQQSAIGFLKKVVVGLGDITGRDGKPVSYSDGMRDQLIALPFVRRPIVRGYFNAVYQAKLGN